MGLLQLALVIGTQELPQDVAPAGQVVELLRGQIALADQALQALRFLLSVLLVGANLLEYFDVVLGVLVLQSCRKGGSLINAVTVGRLELRDDSIKSLNGATRGIQTTADSTVCAGILVEVLNERIFRTSALVWGGLGGTLLEEFDGRVRGDTLLLSKGLCVLGFRIDLGDQNVGLVDKGVGKSLPDGSEGFAV